jgi:HD-GYP domain-containing protein (c-di-GMP phosphodiesterase class II)
VLKRLVQQIIDVIALDAVILLGLMRLSRFQRHDASHLVNTAVLALVMARRVQLERGDMVRLGLAALLHEVGVLDLPLDLRRNTTGLSSEEERALGRLPLLTARRLFELGTRGRDALPRLIAAFEDRAHVPPTGVYQFRANTSILAQLLAVADAYAHLTAPRLGSPALRSDAALGIMMTNPEGRFAPWAVRLLGDSIGRYPVGTVVELDSGERAVVFDRPPPGAPATRPRVRLLGPPGAMSGGAIVDLVERDAGGRYRRSIARTFAAHESTANAPHFFLD